MCGPMVPMGIPITDDIHKRYSPELQAAWETFHSWLVQQPDWFISENDMSPEVAQARQLILAAPIPGFESEGLTGADSCYMHGVSERLGQTFPVSTELLVNLN
ncbi:hypothetical protein M1116_02060 [Patescibacteria group bacterium]|nr:hypothetical protein [Patescibacteria group bacterium]